MEKAIFTASAPIWLSPEQANAGHECKNHAAPEWENHAAPEWETQCQGVSLFEYASFWGMVEQQSGFRRQILDELKSDDE